jgi:peroxiredoxin
VLAADGSVLDVASAAAKERIALVVLRGFSGQVCVYCASQTAAIVDRIDEFSERGCRVVLVYPGPAESVPVFIEAVATLGREVPESLTVALDPDLAMVKTLAIEGMLAQPTTLVVNNEAKVDWAYVGEDKQDRPSVDEILREAGKKR